MPGHPWLHQTTGISLRHGMPRLPYALQQAPLKGKGLHDNGYTKCFVF